MNVRLVLTALILSGSVALAQAPDPCATAPQSCATLIETHATSRMRVPNSVVDVVVAITSSGRDLATVQHSLADKSATLLKYLRGQNVQRLITARVSFSPESKYDKSGPDKTVGYNGSSRVSFRATLDKLADILGGVLENGANTIQSTSFTPTEEEIAVARRELAADATRTAAAQAESIAKAAGLRVTSIRNIDMSNESEPTSSISQFEVNDLPLFKGRAAPAAMGPVDTAAGEDTLAIRVNITVAAVR